MSEVAIGIDIGTTSVKAVAVDADGAILERVRVPHRLEFPAPDRMQHDPDEAWLAGPRRALERLGTSGALGLAVAAMVPSLAGFDARPRAMTPGLLYGDARGHTHDLHLPVGMSGEAIGFLNWVAGAAPDAVTYWTAQASANHALSGSAVMDSGSAASIFPLFDGTDWNPEHLDPAGVSREQMPEVAGLGEAVGRLDDGAVVASGLVDALGEQVVAGAVEDGDVLVMCGTTLLTWTVVGEYRDAGGGIWTIPHHVPGKFLMGGPSNAGGLFLDWVRQLVGEADGEGPTDPEAVPVWEPYLRGERTPLHDPTRRGHLHDLDLTMDRGAILRAAYEAAGFVARHHIELAGTEVTRVVAVGGGTRSRAWMRALADATRLPVDVAAAPEGAARGAAFVARLAAGHETAFPDAGRWARTDHRVEPDPGWVEAVERRYRRFRELTAAGAG